MAEVAVVPFMPLSVKMGILEILEKPVKVGCDFADTCSTMNPVGNVSMGFCGMNRGWQLTGNLSGLSCRRPVSRADKGGDAMRGVASGD